MMPERPRDAPAESAPTTRTRFTPPASIVWATAIIVAVLLVYLARELVLLLLLAAGLAYLLTPLVRMAEAAAIRRDIAVTALFIIVLVGLIATSYVLLPRLRSEFNTLYAALPSLTERLDTALDAVQQEIVAEYPVAQRLFPDREVRYERLNAFIEHQTADLPNLVGHLATIAIAAVLVPFLSFFLLRDARKMIQFLMDRLPPAHIETSVAVSCEIERTIGRYVRGLALDGMAIGTAAALGLWALGVNYPLLLGAFSGLANVVPYLGPILGAGVATLVALIQFQSLAPLGKVLMLYLFIKILDDVVLQPTIVGMAVHLHPVLLLASVIVGGHSFGLIGMIVAVPAVTVLQETTKLLLERRRYHAGLHEPHPRTRVPVQPYVC
jgi:predicted PurR-regulated permease PerM